MRSKKGIKFLQQNISRDQAKDTGMAMVLICLILGFFYDEAKIYIIAIVLLLVNMTVPVFYRPVAKIWFGLSNILGTIMTFVLLTLLFFFLVTPIGLFRKLLGSDSLKLTLWKKDNSSVFESRDHEFNSSEIETPY